MKQKFLRLSMMVIAMMAFVSSFAYDACIDGVYYILNSESKTATITYGEGSPGFSNFVPYQLDSLTVPESIEYNGETYSITEIGDYAFNESSLKKIVISKSINRIGIEAFCYCSSLKEIIINSSDLNIDKACFVKSERIESITINSSVPPTIISWSVDRINYGLSTGISFLNAQCFEDDIATYAILYVPSKSTDKYGSTYGWRNFKKIRPIESVDGISTIWTNESKSEKIFDLSGKIVNSNQRGIQITNGKKVINKTGGK